MERRKPKVCFHTLLAAAIYLAIPAASMADDTPVEILSESKTLEHEVHNGADGSSSERFAESNSMTRERRNYLEVELAEISARRPNQPNVSIGTSYGAVPQELLRAARAGNPQAQYRLGHLYLNGINGVVRDYAAARYWFERAAASNHPMAQNDLGSLYMNGYGVPRNLDRALYWYQLAARQGVPVANYNAGMVYYRKGLFERAAIFFRAASLAGYSKANYWLSRTLNHINGVSTLPVAIVGGRPAPVRPLPLPVRHHGYR